MSAEISDSIFQAQLMMDANEETITVFGSDALDQLAGYVTLEEYKNIMLVLGGISSRESGAFERIMRSPLFGKLDLNMPCFENVPPEPDTDCVRAIVEMMKKEKPEIVVAVGGGSVMDAAKAACLSWQTGEDIDALFGKEAATKKFPEMKFKKIAAVPTTAGTGSEVTCYSNIIDAKTGLKKVIADSAVTPFFAAVDPAYTLSVPEKITRATGFDALVHAIESFLNFRAGEAHPETREWARQAIHMIVPALPIVLLEPHNINARAEMSAAATLAGMAIRTAPTSLPHLLSYSFCGKASHGCAVAALLPGFWRFYLEEAEVRRLTMELADVFPGCQPLEVIESYERFIHDCGGTVSPGELTGETTSMIAQLAKDAAQNPVKLESAPRKIAVEDCGRIFRDVLEPFWNRK